MGSAIYDACVLYPASIRSFLMWIGVNDLVRARWTERILDECFNNLVSNRPDLELADLNRTRTLMCEAIPDCLVTGFESRIDELSLPDPKDRHVLAAAIEAKADYIVTFNLRDFPKSQLQEQGIEAIHPDDFVLSLVERSPSGIVRCVEDEASIRINPNRSVADVLDSLERRGLTRSAGEIRSLIDEVD